MALHKLPKHYHPDFRLPNKKPVGDVEIDYDLLRSWGVADNLKFFLFPDGNSHIDLVKNIKPSSRGVGWGDIYTNQGLISDAGTESQRFAASSITLGGSSAITIISQYYPSTLATNVGHSVFRQNGSVIPVQYSGSTTPRVPIWIGGLIIVNSATPSSLNKLETLTATWESGGTVDLYQNSVYQSSSAIKTGILNSTSNDFCVGGTETNAEDFDGGCGVCIGFDCRLTADVRAKIERNPYQILKPKQAPIYFTSDAGGGGVTGLTSLSTQLREPIASTTSISASFREPVTGTSSFTSSFREPITNTNAITTLFREAVTSTTSLNTDFRQGVSSTTPITFDLLGSSASFVTSLTSFNTSFRESVFDSTSITTSFRESVSQTHSLNTSFRQGVSNTETLLTSFIGRVTHLAPITTSFREGVTGYTDVTFALYGELDWAIPAHRVTFTFNTTAVPITFNTTKPII